MVIVTHHTLVRDGEIAGFGGVPDDEAGNRENIIIVSIVITTDEGRQIVLALRENFANATADRTTTDEADAACSGECSLFRRLCVFVCVRERDKE